MAEGSVVREHWLHGKCYFNVDVERDDRCCQCTHAFVCKHEMEALCENFNWGTSEGRGGCDHCLHKYTRYANKDSIPCFSCLLFEHRENLRPVADYFEVWQSHEDGQPAFRLGFTTAAVQRQHKKLRAYIDKHADDISCAAKGRPVEFVPITEREFEYHQHKSEVLEKGWLVEFTMDMIS